MDETKSLALARTFLGKTVHVKMDRPLGSLHPAHGFRYEVNYGYIPGTLAPDGEALDAYFLGSDVPLEEAEGVCIAIIHRLDDDDDKLVVASEGTSFSDEEIAKLTDFQERFFKTVIVR
jgi:inorganic pyrophosphatase